MSMRQASTRKQNIPVHFAIIASTHRVNSRIIKKRSTRNISIDVIIVSSKQEVLMYLTIEKYHPSKRSKNIDMRSLKNRSPCNFSDPSHTNECCDRVPGPPHKVFTQKQRLQNGPCKNWNESRCSFTELCKFAHIQICHFQKQCRKAENCRFFHFDGNNQDFLGGKAYIKSFHLNLEDFPPLPKRN